jgi:hypothetical protein
MALGGLPVHLLFVGEKIHHMADVGRDLMIPPVFPHKLQDGPVFAVQFQIFLDGQLARDVIAPCGRVDEIALYVPLNLCIHVCAPVTSLCRRAMVLRYIDVDQAILTDI